MNPSDPASAPPKPGLSGIAIAGIGCGALVLFGLLAVIILFKGCMVKMKEVADNPAKAAAMFAVKANPDLDLVKTDDAKGEITVRDKKTGEETTMSFNALSQGKFEVKNSKGETVSVDASGAGGTGKVVVNSPDGSTTIGGDSTATLPPKWVPAYPAAQSQTGGVKQESKDIVRGTYTIQTKDSPGKVKTYFESTLKADGFETSVNTIDTDGAESVVITASNDGGKRKITIMANSEKGSTNLVISYEGAK